MTSSADLAIMKMVTDIAVAQISNNKVDTVLLPQLLADCFHSLKGMERGGQIEGSEAVAEAEPKQSVAALQAAEEVRTEASPRPRLVADNSAAEASVKEAPEQDTKTEQRGQTTQKPAVPIEDSVQDDYIVCLEDGKHLMMLKRYLRTHYDMSVEEYRRKWGLPADYPTVAPAYSRQKSKMAKATGLGKRNKGRKRATSGAQA